MLGAHAFKIELRLQKFGLSKLKGAIVIDLRSECSVQTQFQAFSAFFFCLEKEKVSHLDHNLVFTNSRTSDSLLEHSEY